MSELRCWLEKVLLVWFWWLVLVGWFGSGFGAGRAARGDRTGRRTCGWTARRPWAGPGGSRLGGHGSWRWRPRLAELAGLQVAAWFAGLGAMRAAGGGELVVGRGCCGGVAAVAVVCGVGGGWFGVRVESLGGSPGRESGSPAQSWRSAARGSGRPGAAPSSSFTRRLGRGRARPGPGRALARLAGVRRGLCERARERG